MPLKKTELKQIRDAFSESEGHDLRLSDESISTIVEAIDPAEWNEMEDEAKMKLFSSGEQAMGKIAIADPSITALVAKMDDTFEAELTECIDATMKAKTTAVDLYAQFKRLYKKAELDELPYPGTDAEDVQGTNYKPDISEKKTPTGPIRTVFSNDFVEAMPRGKQFQLDIDDATKELKTPGSVPRLKGKNKKELRSMLALATAQRNALRSMVKRSIALHHQWSAIEGMELVDIQWIPGHNRDKCPIMPKQYGKAEGAMVSNSPKPIWICPIVDGKVSGGEGLDFSITQLLAFDVPKAIKAGGTVGDLVDSAKRGPDDTETSDVLTPDKLDTYVVSTWAYLSERDNIAALRKRLVSEGNEDTREAYCALALILKPIYEANRKWYEARLESDTEGGDTSKAVGKAA